MVHLPAGALTAVGWLKVPFTRWRERRADRERLTARLRRDAEYERYVSPYGAIVMQSAVHRDVYLCPKCFEDGHHYALQSRTGARDTRHHCPSCRASYQVLAPYKPPPNPPQKRRGNWMTTW
jgi:hypothetical protein